MNKPDFDSMSRQELRQYMLDHRDDKEAFEFYLDKFRNPNNPIYPAPQGLEDMAYLQKILLDKNPNNDNESTNQ